MTTPGFASPAAPQQLSAMEAEKVKKEILQDFNNAYNPACAFSNHYNCPIPPKENALPVAIRAGEMDSR